MGIEEILRRPSQSVSLFEESIAERAIIVGKTLNQLGRGYNPNDLTFT